MRLWWATCPRVRAPMSGSSGPIARHDALLGSNSKLSSDISEGLGQFGLPVGGRFRGLI